MERENIMIQRIGWNMHSQITFYAERITDPEWCTVNEFKKIARYIHQHSQEPEFDMGILLDYLQQHKNKYYRTPRLLRSVMTRIEFLRKMGYIYDRERTC